MIKLNDVEIKPTIFPDKTSQVWQVSSISPIANHILWDFENEAEVFQVLQLIALTESMYKKSTVLEMPTMPYARQDKLISNESSFAGRVFVELIENTGVRVIVTDVHNKALLPRNWYNRKVDDRIAQVVKETKADIVCFPDYGAANRNYNISIPSIALSKTRDPLSGAITRLAYYGSGEELAGKYVLIIDDLCDGGRTFIEAAKVLYKAGASEVHLYTTHGIYSKGVGVLKEAGLKRVFNYKGEV